MVTNFFLNQIEGKTAGYVLAVQPHCFYSRDMILKQLLNGRHHSDFILIKDNLNISGQKLLKLFIANTLSRGNNVIFFMYEHPTYEFNQEFLSCKNFLAYNCFDDPWNWLGDSESNKYEKLIASELMKNGNSMNVIIIDSLIYLLLQLDIYSLCNSFKEIFESNSETNRYQIITVLHKNSLSEDNIEFRQVDCMAKSVITLKHDVKKKLNLMVVEHRKPSGKILNEEYSCCLDSQGNLTYETFKDKPKEVPVAETNPMELTTFKLSLEDHEKESRSRVVLPYVKTEERQGRIIYVPDANDDWDDEDPDDDLEI